MDPDPDLLQHLLSSVQTKSKTVSDLQPPLTPDQLRYLRCLQLLTNHLQFITPLVLHLTRGAPRYDFENVPANGFRSWLSVTKSCLLRLRTMLDNLSFPNTSSSFLQNTFKHSVRLRDFEEFTKVLGALSTLLNQASRMMAEQERKGSLFLRDGSPLIDEWYSDVETLDQAVFYGKSLGFQYCQSISNTIHTISVAMAVCAETYERDEKRRPGSAQIATTIPGVGSLTKHMTNAEIRAKLLVDSSRNCDLNFCKQFWNLTTAWYMQLTHSWLVPKVAVNMEMELQPQLLHLLGQNGQDMVVRPASWTKSVHARLISHQFRDGQDAASARSKRVIPQPLSQWLIFHCHGGGFIAQSSKAHEVYLLNWAKELNVPIFTIDYALAPEHPYPEPVNEVLFAYAWALKNADQLGWTGERVCFVGDSAGGNLVTSAAMKAACCGLKRPDGLLAVYTPLLAQYAPSPSRMMCLMDPLLPLGILISCLAAYAYRFPEPVMFGHVQGIDDGIDEGTYGPTNQWRLTEKQKAPTAEASIDPDVDVNVLNNDDCQPSDAAAPAQVVPLEAQVPLISTPDVMTPLMSDESITSQNSSYWFLSGVTGLMQNFCSKLAEPLFSVFAASSSAPPNPNPVQRPSGQQTYPLETVLPSWPAKQVPALPRAPLAAVSALDPFLSPLLAEDQLLELLPPVYLVACHLDPLLDDSITFARRLKQINKPVHLDVLKDLPHGFLSFALMSKEASLGSDFCLKRVREILDLPPLT